MNKLLLAATAVIGFAAINTANAADMALKAPLASPTFTGNATAPTPGYGSNDTHIATTAHVKLVVAPLATTSYVDAADAGREPVIAAGTTAQYWRGDKTWAALPSAGIPDAPSDGITYGRNNGAWSPIIDAGTF